MLAADINIKGNEITMGNKNMNKARVNQDDEFYTKLEDIQSELYHFIQHFSGKVILMNADNPAHSKFWTYFYTNFKNFGIKKIIATYYEEDDKSIMTEYDGVSIKKTELFGTGDFRGDEVVSILKEADLVITNPPFSLFREFVAQMYEYNKKFIVVGNLYAINYKEIFPLLMDNKIWTGPSFRRALEFRIPDEEEIQSAKSGRVDEDGNKFIKIQGIVWWTNLSYLRRAERLTLDARYKGNEKRYNMFDNYDVLNVDKVKDIPIDYTEGIMGVPITFIGKFNPEQFKIVGITDRQNTYGYRTKKYTKDDADNFNDLNSSGVIKVDGEYKIKYARILIKRVEQ